ncbi:heavy metal translocating P-type ATPase [Pseudaestuariivita atlantica]|uniref:P-type Zn(2+) transporter n=1 Tax=Pseudaestuariivita atlantica TaxID=1317121 RepID=A0A0L1JQD6_9RHOB|nr:heavy metal translocating P-type ATPase [Pseudaestuariivita atlantica]KNG93638.1 haloacid dehalogenase [Pseudaestuariivita atlantica]
MRFALLVVAVSGLVGGLVFQYALDDPLLATASYVVAAVPVLAALVWEIVTSLVAGDVGLDVVAALSMTAALVFGEYTAAAIVALMYTGGQYLESYADGRASREMTALLARVPKTVMRQQGDGLVETPIDAVQPGDHLLIRAGDVVPVDGQVSGTAVLDESSLTGESVPVRHADGASAMSGSVNVGDAFVLVASKAAADSTYAGIVRLVKAAQASKAPMARMADRYAMAFLAVTLAITGAAWALTGDPIRAVAVLVVATPCPLILAVPVALSAGLSRAAGSGVLIKGGKVLERMAGLRTVVMDKTGTLTHGEARLTGITTTGGMDGARILQLAASLEQASTHPIAARICKAAMADGLALESPRNVVETAGEGLTGMVGGHEVVVGQPAFVGARAAGTPPQDGVAVAVDGRIVGAMQLQDALRDDVQGLLGTFRRAGISRIVVATGDKRAVAEQLTRGLPVDAVHAEMTPEEKSELVASESRLAPTMMIGDGVNDAPALAIADVGVAMGVRGAAATAETADAVLLVDRISALGNALRASQRARAIAFQSVALGVGLSVAGMIAAAFGYLTPVQGAVFQEVIDVAAILNALRALRSPKPAGASLGRAEPLVQ